MYVKGGGAQKAGQVTVQTPVSTPRRGVACRPAAAMASTSPVVLRKEKEAFRGLSEALAKSLASRPVGPSRPSLTSGGANEGAASRAS